MNRLNKKLNSYLIFPNFQIRFLRYMMTAVVGTLMIVYGAVLYFFYNLTSFGKSIGLTPDHPFFRFIGDQKIMMNTVLFVAGAIACLSWVCIGFFLSHRIANSLTHLSKLVKIVRVNEKNGKRHRSVA